MTSKLDIEQVLKRTDVFLGLDDADLSKIASLPSCHKEICEPGRVLCMAGESARYLYVLEDGQVDLLPGVINPTNKDDGLVVERVTTGSLLGWSALVEPHYYALSAVCNRTSKVVAIDGTELLGLFEQDYRLGYTVLCSLVRIIGTRVRLVEQFLIMGKRWPLLEKRKNL